MRDLITQICLRQGWSRPLWLETTVEDPGYGQARQALASGVDLVCALGGDGTVRAIAQGLAHSNVPLGLLPAGTGNILARNLDLPYQDLAKSLTIALTGHNRSIDVGRITFERVNKPQSAEAQVFLVMAGLGFDAAMMADVSEKLKSQVGWIAYAMSGARHLRRSRVRAKITIDAELESSLKIQTVLVSNCGLLTGGIRLVPQAELDDGWLDVVSLSPKGMLGWASLAARVLVWKQQDPLQHKQFREISVRLERPTPGQLDGDSVGLVHGMTAEVDPGALVVRVA